MPNKSFEEYLDLIAEIHTKVKNIEQVLKGYDGNPGLCKIVESNRKAITKIWIIIAFVLGGGGFTFGIAELVKAIA